MTIFSNNQKSDIKETQKRVAERFFNWAEQEKKTLVELSKLFSASSASLSNWKTRGIPVSQWRTAAEIMGIPSEILTASKGETTILTGKFQMLPLINSVHAGAWTGVADDTQEEFMPVYTACSKHSFCLKVEGDSMKPTFHEGDIVVVDPDVSPTPGKCVVARKANDQEATIKRYKQVGIQKDGSYIIELIPDNPMYASFRSDEVEIAIIGVVVGYYRPL